MSVESESSMRCSEIAYLKKPLPEAKRESLSGKAAEYARLAMVNLRKGFDSVVSEKEGSDHA